MGKSCNVWCQCHSNKKFHSNFFLLKKHFVFWSKFLKIFNIAFICCYQIEIHRSKFMQMNGCLSKSWQFMHQWLHHNLTSNIKNTKGDSIEYQFECNRYFNIYGHLHIKWIEDCLQITFELNWIIHQMYTQFILRILVFTSVLRCKFSEIDNNFKFLRIFWISNRKWGNEWIIQNPLLLIRFIWVNRTVISHFEFWLL